MARCYLPLWWYFFLIVREAGLGKDNCVSRTRLCFTTPMTLYKYICIIWRAVVIGYFSPHYWSSNKQKMALATPPHDKNYEKIHIFRTTLTLKNKIHFPVRAPRVSIAIWWWDQTDKILFFWKNIPPLGNTSPKSGGGGFCIIFQIWSNTGRPEKKLLSESCWLHGAQAQSPVAGTPRGLLKLWGP